MSKLVIYTRSSIPDYLRVDQENALKEQKDKILHALGGYSEYAKEFVSDKGTESLSSHPELNKAIDNMQTGDALVVYSLDKLGLPSIQLINLFAKLNKKDVNFISLKEKINTIQDGKALFLFSNSVIKCERKLRSERGILSQLGKTSLKKGGRKTIPVEKEKELVQRHFINKERHAKLIWDALKISKGTFYNYVKKHKYDYKEFLAGEIS